jgi:hypothetical protein
MTSKIIEWYATWMKNYYDAVTGLAFDVGIGIILISLFFVGILTRNKDNSSLYLAVTLGIILTIGVLWLPVLLPVLVFFLIYLLGCETHKVLKKIKNNN